MGGRIYCWRIGDTVKDMDKESEMFDFEDELRLQKLYEPARIRYEEKIPSHQSTATATELPQLPSLVKYKSLLNEEIETQETMKITIRRQNIVQESQSPIVPLDFNKASISLRQQNIASEELRVPLQLTKQQQESRESTSEKDSVVTSQPTSSMGLFSSKSQDEGYVPNFEDVPTNMNMSLEGLNVGRGVGFPLSSHVSLLAQAWLFKGGM